MYTNHGNGLRSEKTGHVKVLFEHEDGREVALTSDVCGWLKMVGLAPGSVVRFLVKDDQS